MSNSTNPIGKKLLKPAEAADYLSVAVKTLAKWRCEGGGPVFTKINRHIRYDLADLEKWIQNKKFESTSRYPSGDHSEEDDKDLNDDEGIVNPI
jgi:predicted site-specific integrase-resolvase